MNVAAAMVGRLEDHGVDRCFCLPGESYLEMLNALRDSTIDTVVARQEGGAAIMAEADAKLTGKVGICFVTRGPGAANASAGVHIAQQDSTPLILFVGQVASTMIGRDSFQEVDFDAFFGGMANAVLHLREDTDPFRLVDRAVTAAQSDRPGPVVVVLPEDLQHRGVVIEPPPSIETVSDPINTTSLVDLLTYARRPIVLAGGGGWCAEDVAALERFAEIWDVPVSVTFRRQHLFNHDHRSYAGDCGIGINPSLRARIEDADLVVVMGSRFSEVPSQSFTLLENGQPDQKLVHIHASEVGRFPQADVIIGSHPSTVLTQLARLNPEVDRGTWTLDAHQDYLRWSDPPSIPGDVQMGVLIKQLRARLADEAIVCNGAGNYATWVHRFFRFRNHGSQLAPTSGSMGYGLPAAIAAKMRYPDREVVCLAGDGCLQMTIQEFGTAVQYCANVVVIVIDNGMYGTIRMHQERNFPGRVHATDIINPNFKALAEAYGGFGIRVDSTEEFAEALHLALNAAKPALIHVRLDPEAITPDRRLSELARVS